MGCVLFVVDAFLDIVTSMIVVVPIVSVCDLSLPLLLILACVLLLRWQ